MGSPVPFTLAEGQANVSGKDRRLKLQLEAEHADVKLFVIKSTASDPLTRLASFGGARRDLGQKRGLLRT
jgi:hypothetical protein